MVETLRTSEKIRLLQVSLETDVTRLSDLNTGKLGTNRRSEIYAKIEPSGVPFEEGYNNYLKSL